MPAIKKLIAALTPWFNWSLQSVWRLDSLSADFDRESLGDVGRFEVQWLGIHFAIETGRTPRRVTDDEAAIFRIKVAEFQSRHGWRA